MRTHRRQFLSTLAAVNVGAMFPLHTSAEASDEPSYPYLGRTNDYSPLRVIDAGRTITAVES